MAVADGQPTFFTLLRKILTFARRLRFSIVDGILQLCMTRMCQTSNKVGVLG